MKVLIAGSSGMIGGIIKELSLNSETISEVRELIRKPKDAQDPKLKSIIIKNFTTYDNNNAAFQNIEAAFFCVGAYTGQVPKEQFKAITVDYAVGFAKMLQAHSPKARLCLLSGAGADRSEKSRTSFARFKGMAENQISSLSIEFYTFRPGYIYPVEPRQEPSVMYRMMRWMYPLIRLFGKNASIKSTELAEAMFKVGLNGASEEIIENREILELLRA